MAKCISKRNLVTYSSLIKFLESRSQRIDFPETSCWLSSFTGCFFVEYLCIFCAWFLCDVRYADFIHQYSRGLYFKNVISFCISAIVLAYRMGKNSQNRKNGKNLWNRVLSSVTSPYVASSNNVKTYNCDCHIESILGQYVKKVNTSDINLNGCSYAVPSFASYLSSFVYFYRVSFRPIYLCIFCAWFLCDVRYADFIHQYSRGLYLKNVISFCVSAIVLAHRMGKNSQNRENGKNLRNRVFSSVTSPNVASSNHV